MHAWNAIIGQYLTVPLVWGTTGGSDLGGQIIVVNVCMNIIMKHH